MRSIYIAGILVVALTGALIIPPALAGQEKSQTAQTIPPKKPKTDWWKKKGCSHGHKSSVSYKRITRLLRIPRPTKKGTSGKVGHYIACVKTRDKSRAVRKHAKRQYTWRKKYPQKHAIVYQRDYQSIHGHLASIAACESGGNPRAISSTGMYRGKYQFSRQTWGGVGGYGDPAAAHEWEQDHRAAILYVRSGAGQWPVCGS